MPEQLRPHFAHARRHLDALPQNGLAHWARRVRALAETPISARQRLEPLPGTEWKRLSAWVPMDQETLWWVFALNDQIRLYDPRQWVNELKSLKGYYT